MINRIPLNKLFSCFPLRIRDIPAPAFQDLHSLEWVKLFNNDLRTLTYELMEPVLDTLVHIDIHSEQTEYTTNVLQIFSCSALRTTIPLPNSSKIRLELKICQDQ